MNMDSAVKITIDRGLHIEKVNIQEKDRQRIREFFQAANFKYTFLFQKHGRVHPNIPSHIRDYREDENEFLLARNTVEEVKFVLSGYLLQFIDKENKAPKIEFDQVYHKEEFDLRPYQETAVENAVQLKKAILVAGCGSGKTVMGMEIIKRLSTSTVIIVHTKDLLEQWYSIIKKYLGVEPAVFSGSQNKVGQITLVMSQKLSNGTFSPEVYGQLVNPGLLIIDECHIRHYQHAHRFNCEYKIGLTATPERADGTARFVNWAFGKQIIAATHEELVANAYRVEPNYKAIETSFFYPYLDRSDYSKMLKALVNDPVRNSLILDNVEAAVKEKRYCLVLTGVKKHAELLAESLQSRKLNATYLHSGITLPDRQAIIEKMRKGELQVLVATSLADVGLDIPILDALFITYPSKSSNLNTQRAGRIMRLHPDKNEKPIIIDFCDLKMSILKFQYRYRLKAFRKVCSMS